MVAASNDDWFPVPRFEGYYERNRIGQHRSLRHSKGVRPVPRILKPVRMPTGYLKVVLHAGDKKKNVSIARSVLEVNVGPCPPGMQACHNNGVRDDNRPENLRWDTPLANSADKFIHGTICHGETHYLTGRPERALRGENHGRSVLSEQEACRVIQSLEDGASVRAIAEMLDVSEGCIYLIRRGVSWSHLPRGPRLLSPPPDRTCCACGSSLPGKTRQNASVTSCPTASCRRVRDQFRQAAAHLRRKERAA